MANSGSTLKELGADAFIKLLSPLLKQQGFKKSNSTWRRDQGESTAVFNVQKSQWDGGRYYINIGTYFRAFGSDAAPTENKCHVRVRLSVDEPSNVVPAAMDWFEARKSVEAAAKLAETDSKRGLVFKELRSAAAATPSI